MRYVRGNARFYFENNAALLKYFLSLSKPSETNIENKKRVPFLKETLNC
nr:MAG TPA: hypothetical protein [Caudoviricetes sp.]